MRELIHNNQFAGHFAVVLGAGATGLAAARLLSALGARVRVVDRGAFSGEALREAEARGWEMVSGEHTPGQFEGLDLLVVSPGVPLAKLAHALEGISENKIIGELELASWFTTEPILAVTGTSGKTTTVSLMGRMLEEAGFETFVGGNIGTPLSDYLLSDAKAKVVVLEVSSFQLMHVRSFKPHVGVLLNVSPNHLDYHADVQEYLDAKLKLFARMGPNDLAIAPLEMKDLLEAREFTKAKRQYFVPSERFPDAQLIGVHNRANMEAAWLAVRAFGVDEAAARRAAEAFEPLPHRLEPVAQVDGVLYVNDSKATTIHAMEAAIVAMAAESKGVRLLAGGVWKGGEPEALIPLLTEHVRSVGLFGGAREVFENAWSGTVPLTWHPTLQEAVRAQAGLAQPGEIVLLSPATSSFDQYPGYKARGEDFRAAVEALAQPGGAQ